MRRNAGRFVVGIDLGGTNMQIGVVDWRNRIIGREARKTKSSEGPTAVIDRIVDGVWTACEKAGIRITDVAGAGIAAPGAIDIPRGVVLEAPNLKWRNVALRSILQKKLHCKIIVDNDANAAIWGESQLGAGRGRGDVLGVWLGTGVGGGLVLNGRLYYGEFFTAGEIGHTVLFPGAPKGRATVEDYCSRTGMTRTIRMLLPDHPNSVLKKVRGAASRISSTELAQAFQQGDQLAVSVAYDAADLLGVAIANWITVLALDTVIIGGGVTEALGRPFLQRIKTSFDDHVFPARSRACKLLLTSLQADAGLLGAALLARTMNQPSNE